MDEQLKVLFVATEAVPFAKVGGLAEFSSGLPRALQTLGVDVRLLLPRYGDRSDQMQYAAERVGNSIPVPAGAEFEPAHLLTTQVDGVPTYLLYNDQYFGNRDRVYGFNDDPQRFLFFSRAVIAALPVLGWVPDVVHANDWHTAPIPVWLSVYGPWRSFYRDLASLFTIHNLAFQGISGRLLLSFGKMEELKHLDAEPPGKVNWMAQGIAHADLVSTVSPTYAREIMTPELGGELASLLRRRSDRLFGLLSGIDSKAWDPATDSALVQTFDADSLNMRAVNKTALQRDLRLATSMDTPVIAMVSRLDPMKGLALIPDALSGVLRERDVQFVILGTGEDEEAHAFYDLQNRYPQDVRALIRFDDRLARRIYAGADLVLAPSRQEPVSVGVMSGMRYGSVPVVRLTGGLVDTVLDADQHPDHGTGFGFVEFSAKALGACLRRALACYDDEARWVSIQQRAMARDCSWAASARGYVDLYLRAQRLHRPR
jgi:starch synthase